MMARTLLARLTTVLAVLCAALPGRSQTLHFNLVTSENVQARIQDFKGGNAEREATLKRLFAQSGCDGEHLSEQPVKGSRQPNVICVLPGSADSTIIVGAHFDRVAESKGVVDNWSGASLLPSLLEAMRSEPRRHTYVFVGFTDEEKGMVGSEFYARKLTPEQVAKIDAMVNMDSLGLSSTKVWVSHSDAKLVSGLARVANVMKLELSGVNVEKVGSTDSESFRKRKVPSITVHSLTQETLPILHGPRDDLQAMHLDDYYNSYHLLAAYLAFLDSLSPAGATEASKPASQ